MDSSESQLTQTLKTEDRLHERQTTPNALKIKKQLSINASKANETLVSTESRHKSKASSFATAARPAKHHNTGKPKQGISSYHHISQLMSVTHKNNEKGMSRENRLTPV